METREYEFHMHKEHGMPLYASHAPTLRLSALALLAMVLACSIAGLFGCNTTEGVGKDIEAAGKSIEKAASDAK